MVRGSLKLFTNRGVDLGVSELRFWGIFPMALTHNQIANAKPASRDYKLFDSKGLFLIVSPAGGKSWRFKVKLQRMAAAEAISSNRRTIPSSNSDLVRPLSPRQILSWRQGAKWLCIDPRGHRSARRLQNAPDGLDNWRRGRGVGLG